MKKLLVLLFLIGLTQKFYSQEITLDLLEISKMTDSNSKDFVVVGNVFYFTADGHDLGWELWRSDGTINGTYVVKDINPGENNAFNQYSYLTNINGVLYFNADDGVNGFELWKSDGTESGTVLVKNIANSISSSNPHGFIALNDKVIFACNDGTNGEEIWITDGTVANTVLLKDINLGSANSLPSYFIFFNNKIYFTAKQNATGGELWMTDGTEAGTVIQNDLFPGTPYGVLNNTNMLVFNGDLYFRGRSIDSGYELWKTNGAIGNATLLMDVYPGTQDGFYGKLLTSNNNIVFFDGKTSFYGVELWKTNGTISGTGIVKDINASYEDGLPYTIRYAFINNILYFTAGTTTTGIELWKSDGTNSGTTLVKNIYPGDNSSDIMFLTSIDNILYFSAREELVEDKNYFWKSDGTATGTLLVKDVNLRGMDYGNTNKIFKCNNDIFFAGNSVINGWEIWKSNGTENSTNLFVDLNSQSDSTPKKFTKLNNEIVFSARANLGDELYKSDGTQLGTNLVKDISNASNGSLYDNNNYGKFVKLGNLILFRAASLDVGYELWKSDGTESGTVLVKDIYLGGPGLNENFGNDYCVMNNVLYFTANDGIHGYELWRTDGTELGTFMIKDMTAGALNSNIGSFCTFENKVFFVLGGGQIWSTDGTESGTQLFYTSNGISKLTKVSDKMYFFGPNTLYMTDSNFSPPINLGTWPASGISNIEVFNNEIYFVVQVSGGKTIIKSNGTLSGTIRVKDDLLLYESRKLLKCGNYIYFSDEETFGSIKIWRTDGTSAGTILITGATQSYYYYQEFTCFQDNLFYFYDYSNLFDGTMPDDDLHNKVWRTDGNTFSSHNLVVNGSQNFINNYGADRMFATDDKLYFIANNGYSGRELYVSSPQNTLSNMENHIDLGGQLNNIKVYPNPTNSTFNIKSDKIIYKAEIYNMVGNLVSSNVSETNNLIIDISDKPQGIYILKVITEIGISSFKIIRN